MNAALADRHPAVAEIYRDQYLVIHGISSWLATRRGTAGNSIFYGIAPEAVIRGVADVGEIAELCRILDNAPGAFTLFRVRDDGTVVVATSSLSPGVYVWRDAEDVLHAGERLATPFELGYRLGRVEPLYLAIQLEHEVERFQAHLTPVEGLRHIGGRMSLVHGPQREEICGHTARAWTTHIDNARRLRSSWRYQLGTRSFCASPSGLQKTKEMLDLRYLLDPKTKKAYILGNAGSSEVTPVQHKGGGVTFIEITDTGNVMVTAIAASGEAVHSRNGIIGKMLTPSQYYGNCTVQ